MGLKYLLRHFHPMFRENTVAVALVSISKVCKVDDYSSKWFRSHDQNDRHTHMVKTF